MKRTEIVGNDVFSSLFVIDPRKLRILLKLSLKIDDAILLRELGLIYTVALRRIELNSF